MSYTGREGQSLLAKGGNPGIARTREVKTDLSFFDVQCTPVNFLRSKSQRIYKDVKERTREASRGACQVVTRVRANGVLSKRVG